MHRYLGLLLFVAGVAGGWWIARPPATAVEEVSAQQAWRHFKAETARGHVCEGDIAPHPAWVALALATAALTLLTVTSHHPRQAWQIALGIRSAPATVVVPW